MTPIYSATLFFDSNISKATDIVPIIQKIETYWNNMNIYYIWTIQKFIDPMKQLSF